MPKRCSKETATEGSDKEGDVQNQQQNCMRERYIPGFSNLNSGVECISGPGAFAGNAESATNSFTDVLLARLMNKTLKGCALNAFKNRELSASGKASSPVIKQPDGGRASYRAVRTTFDICFLCLVTRRLPRRCFVVAGGGCRVINAWYVRIVQRWEWGQEARVWFQFNSSHVSSS